MRGLLKINRLVGRSDADYQVNFTVPGNSYARAYTRDGLHEFLVAGIALEEREVDGLFEELIAHGNTVVEKVEIPETELGVLGFDQLPSDF